MTTEDKKTLTAIYSGIALHVWMGKETAAVFRDPEDAANVCVRIGRVMAERLEREFQEGGDA
jgi:hypothetical protein